MPDDMMFGRVDVSYTISEASLAGLNLSHAKYGKHASGCPRLVYCVLLFFVCLGPSIIVEF